MSGRVLFMSKLGFFVDNKIIHANPDSHSMSVFEAAVVPWHQHGIRVILMC